MLIFVPQKYTLFIFALQKEIAENQAKTGVLLL